MFVWRSEWSVTIGSPARARDFGIHTRSSPRQIPLPSSVQKSLSVSPSLSHRQCLRLSHQASYACKYSNNLSGIEIVRFEISSSGSFMIIPKVGNFCTERYILIVPFSKSISFHSNPPNLPRLSPIYKIVKIAMRQRRLISSSRK